MDSWIASDSQLHSLLSKPILPLQPSLYVLEFESDIEKFLSDIRIHFGL